jgi:hypothetical protein
MEENRGGSKRKEEGEEKGRWEEEEGERAGRSRGGGE